MPRFESSYRQFIKTIFATNCGKDEREAENGPFEKVFFCGYWENTLKLITMVDCGRKFFLKKWAIPGLFFFYFHLFNTIQLTINKKCSIKICRCLESNRGLLVSEATALPTEPQPLPYVDASLSPVIVYLPLRFILKIKERDYR